MDEAELRAQLTEPSRDRSSTAVLERLASLAQKIGLPVNLPPIGTV